MLLGDGQCGGLEPPGLQLVRLVRGQQQAQDGGPPLAGSVPMPDAFERLALAADGAFLRGLPGDIVARRLGHRFLQHRQVDLARCHRRDGAGVLPGRGLHRFTRRVVLHQGVGSDVHGLRVGCVVVHFLQHLGRQRHHIEAVDAANALVQRRVRRKHAPPQGRHEEEMRQALGLRMMDRVLSLRRLVGDLAKRPAQPIGAARELHRRGVGQVLALARHCGLEHAARDPSERTHAHQPQSEQRGQAAAATLVGLGQRVAEVVDHLQAPHEADELHVEPNIVVLDVTELVGHHALQLVAREALERAARDGNHGVFGAPSGGEGIDRLLTLQHVDRRRLQVRGNRHFIDDVAHALLVKVARMAIGRIDRQPARKPGHVRAALAQAQRLEPAAAQHEQQHQGGVGLEEQLGVALYPRQADPVDQGQHAVDGEHQHDKHPGKEQHQAARRGPGGILVLAKTHGHGGGPVGALQNCTRTALRSSSLPVACSMPASLKPNSDEITVVGNCCAALL